MLTAESVVASASTEVPKPAVCRRLHQAAYQVSQVHPIANVDASMAEVELRHSCDEEMLPTSTPEKEVETDEADASPAEAEASEATKTASTGKCKSEAASTPPRVGSARKEDAQLPWSAPLNRLCLALFLFEINPILYSAVPSLIRLVVN